MQLNIFILNSVKHNAQLTVLSLAEVLHRRFKKICCVVMLSVTFVLYSICRQEESIIIYPADVILFEGILTIYFKEIRDMLDMKLFVDTDSDTRLSRRGMYRASHD